MLSHLMSLSAINIAFSNFSLSHAFKIILFDNFLPETCHNVLVPNSSIYQINVVNEMEP